MFKPSNLSFRQIHNMSLRSGSRSWFIVWTVLECNYWVVCELCNVDKVTKMGHQFLDNQNLDDLLYMLHVRRTYIYKMLDWTLIRKSKRNFAKNNSRFFVFYNISNILNSKFVFVPNFRNFTRKIKKFCDISCI